VKEKSIFLQTFGDYPLLRILDFLMYSRDFDYPITEIARNSEVNFQTLKKVWPKLEQNKMVVSTRTLAGATLFKLNVENLVVKKIVELNNFLCWQTVEKEETEIIV